MHDAKEPALYCMNVIILRKVSNFRCNYFLIELTLFQSIKIEMLDFLLITLLLNNLNTYFCFKNNCKNSPHSKISGSIIQTATV